MISHPGPSLASLMHSARGATSGQTFSTQHKFTLALARAGWYTLRHYGSYYLTGRHRGVIWNTPPVWPCLSGGNQSQSRCIITLSRPSLMNSRVTHSGESQHRQTPRTVCCCVPPGARCTCGTWVDLSFSLLLFVCICAIFTEWRQDRDRGLAGRDLTLNVLANLIRETLRASLSPFHSSSALL